MLDFQTIAIFATVGASIFVGISVGASAVAPAFAPVTSSGYLSILKAALLAGIAAMVGAVVQGGRVTTTVGTNILGGEIILAQSFIILLVASILVIISVITDYPMPTAFTIVGAVIGSGLGFGNVISWSSVYVIVGYWLAIPFLSIAIGYSVSRILRKYIPIEETGKKFKYPLMLLGLFVAYTSGANSVGKAVGPLAPLNIPMITLLILGGVSILLGAWFLSPRIINAVSFDYSNIGPRRSAAALVTAALLAQVGVFIGVPISFNQAIIASIIGSGLVVGKTNVGTKKLTFTILAWIMAFFTAAGLTFLVGYIFF